MVPESELERTGTNKVQLYAILAEKPHFNKHEILTKLFRNGKLII